MELRHTAHLIGFKAEHSQWLTPVLGSLGLQSTWTTPDTWRMSFLQCIPTLVFIGADTLLQEALDILSLIRSVAPSLRVHCFRETGSKQEWIALLQGGATSVNAMTDIAAGLERVACEDLAKVGIGLNAQTLSRYPQEGGIATRLGALEFAAIAKSDIDILLLEPQGYDEAALVKKLHDLSPRASKPLLTVDCASLSESLAESELFGHTKGAFSGADRERQGLMRSAEGGTLFLSKVENLSPGVQAKLLRALQEREVRPVGSMRAFKIDIRLISTSSVDLMTKVKLGEFREDLLFRLSVYSKHIPGLNHRRDEIPAMVRGLLASECQRMGEPLIDMGLDAIALLMGADWPGDSAQLRSVIQHAVLTCQGKQIGATTIKKILKLNGAYSLATYSETGESLLSAHLQGLHEYYQGSVAKMARASNLHRSTVYRMLSATAH